MQPCLARGLGMPRAMRAVSHLTSDEADSPGRAVTFVIGASVALKWFIEEEGTTQAHALLTEADMLIAPDPIVEEVTNAGWEAVRAGSMLPEQHDHAAARLPFAFDSRSRSVPWRRARWRFHGLWTIRFHGLWTIQCTTAFTSLWQRNVRRNW
jgi:hypothetical protein